MTQTVVCDASVIVALLLDGGDDGTWAATALTGAALAAPALLDFEVANVLRRHERAGVTSADTAAQAHADVLDLAIERWPYELLAGRAWELRHNLSTYDGSYVALAEFLHADLLTLDTAIARAPGIGCVVRTPASR